MYVNVLLTVRPNSVASFSFIVFSRIIDNSSYLGSSSAGKTTLLNHLLGKSIVPTDHKATTTSEVRYGQENVAFLQYVGGNGEKVRSNQLNLTTEEGQTDKQQ